MIVSELKKKTEKKNQGKKTEKEKPRRIIQIIIKNNQEEAYEGVS